MSTFIPDYLDGDVDGNANSEALNYGNNVDADGDGIADSQFSGLTCWACDAPNFYECALVGKPMKCSNTQVSIYVNGGTLITGG